MAKIDPVSGDRELVAALRILGRGLPPSALDRAMTKAATPMLADAREKAKQHRQPGRRPKGGHLDEGLVLRRNKKSSAQRREFIIGGINRARFLIPWLEYGTAPHFQPRRFGGIMHPGARAFPFMRPAYETNKDDVRPIFAHEIMQTLQAMIMKLPKGRRR